MIIGARSIQYCRGIIFLSKFLIWSSLTPEVDLKKQSFKRVRFTFLIKTLRILQTRIYNVVIDRKKLYTNDYICQ